MLLSQNVQENLFFWYLTVLFLNLRHNIRNSIGIWNSELESMSTFATSTCFRFRYFISLPFATFFSYCQYCYKKLLSPIFGRLSKRQIWALKPLRKLHWHFESIYWKCFGNYFVVRPWKTFDMIGKVATGL